MLLIIRLLTLVIPLTPSLFAQDWTNYGGNEKRNGRTDVVGPTALDSIWSNTQDASIISWHPFLLDDRVFVIRESGFPQDGGTANDTLLALDLNTGQEIWRTTLPFGGNTSQEWIAWIGGARDDKVYASRSSNLQPQPIQAYSASSGSFLWESEVSTEAWAHDGVVFAPNGDLIVGDRLRLVRINHADGTTVWETARSCPVSGNCGAALANGDLYVDEPAGGGNQITKLDLATGAILYSSPVMPGFTTQNAPFAAPNGTTIYFSRTQNNASVDFLYSFEDTGSALVENWHREVRWTTSHEHGIADDGSIYTFTPQDEFVRLDPATGNITANAGALSPLGNPNTSPKTIVDGHGRVYVSNGWGSSPASNGRLWAFDGSLSRSLFTLNLDRQNAGGPALGGDSILVMADRTGVYAYQTPLWTDLGGALAGSLGNPVLEGRGTLQPNTLATISLESASPLAPATLIVGLSRLDLPFRGGTIIPNVDLLLTGLFIDGDGELILDFDAPAGTPSSVDLYFQYWILDAAGSQGFAASNGIFVTTP